MKIATTRRRARPATPTRSQRFVARETADQTLALGLDRPWFGDLYHRTLQMGWGRFLVAGALLYFGANVVFALLYMAQPGAVANAQPGSFPDAFFFSIQTIATLGYGQLWPATLYANLVVTAETSLGLLFLALLTGLALARFARPTARVLFSRVAVVGPQDGLPTLSFRIANQRRNQILQAEVGAYLLLDEETEEGETFRRLHDLRLLRHRTPVFAMTFIVRHPIDRTSPLHDATAASLEAQNAELVVAVTGIDETMAAPVHARTSYLAHEIIYDHRFVDVIGWTEDGRRSIDYRRFHDTVPLAGRP